MDKSCRIITQVLLLLHLLLSSGSGASSKTAPNGKQTKSKFAISSPQKDITTPLTTVPTQTPPAASTPILNPNSNAESDSPAAMTPMTIPDTGRAPPAFPGASWCIASQNAAKTALQNALDYACGIGGADCSAVQIGGECYYPNTLNDHASFAFNGYYQKNPIPSSCNFGGTAVTTSTDPSTGSCRYPSTSTSESILNITNTNGARIFGGVPSDPIPSSEASNSRTFYFVFFLSYLTLVAL